MQISTRRLSAIFATAFSLFATAPVQAQPPNLPELNAPSNSGVDATSLPVATVSDSAGPLVVRTRNASLRLVERGSRIVELPDNITHVTDFDPNVLEVVPISPTTVRVLAVSPGVTSIVFTDVHEVARSLEVFVAGDTRHLEAHLEYLFPDAAIKAFQVGQNVVLRGYVSRPSQITEIMDVAAEFYPQVHNQLQVSTDDRVVLHAKVAEVNRSRLRQFGMNFTGFGTDAIVNNVTGGIGAASAFTSGTFFALQEGVLANPNFAFAIRNGAGEYGLFIEALKQEAILRILAEPKVTATSGRPATLLSGGEFPILVPQGLGQTAIEFREFGVSIEAVVIVLGDGRVRLDISPEVSDLDFTNGVTLDGIRIPGLTTRRVNTQAEMRFGETLVLGGLISKRRIGSTTKVPFLGELPVIGAAFSRKRYESAETELLIMVTPLPAAPYGPGECMPPAPGEMSSDPTDAELYWAGMLELPKYGERCGPGGCPTGGCPTGDCQPTMGVMDGGMVVPDGYSAGYPTEPALVPMPTTDFQPVTEPAGQPIGQPYMPPPVTSSKKESSENEPSVSQPAFTAPVAQTPAVKRPTQPATTQSSYPTAMAEQKWTAKQQKAVTRLPASQVGFRTAAGETPKVQIATPAATQAPIRSRFNPFGRRKGDPTLNAPRPSGPATSGQPTTPQSQSRQQIGDTSVRQPRSQSGLITPSEF